MAAESLGAVWIKSQNAASDLDLRHGLQPSRVRGDRAFADVRRVGIGSGRSEAVPIHVPELSGQDLIKSSFQSLASFS